MSIEKTWLNNEPILKPTIKQGNPVITPTSPEVLEIRQMQADLMKRYIGAEGPTISHEEFSTLARHARKAAKSKTISAKERESMMDVAITMELLSENK